MPRLSVILPDDLHTRFKVVCVFERKDMSEIIRKLVEEYVEKAEKKPKKK